MAPRAKRRLGQHFLTDPRLLGRIADALGAGPDRHGARDRPRTRRAHRGAGRARRAARRHREGRRSRPRAPRSGFPRRPSSRAMRSTLDWRAVAGGRVPGRRQHPLQHHVAADRQGARAPRPARIVFLVQKEVADRVSAAARRPRLRRAQRGRPVGGPGRAAVHGAGRRVPSASQGGFRGAAADAAGRSAGAPDGAGGLPSARGRDVRLPAQADARGLRELTGWDARIARGPRSTRRRSRPTSGRRCCRRRRSSGCCGRSLTGGGRRGSFVKCFTKMPAMRKVADSTVRRLSLYLRFLEEFEGQGIDDGELGRPRVPRRHHLGAGAEGPLVLRLVREARPGLSGARAGRPAARDPGAQAALSGRDDRGGEDRQRAGAVPRIPAARASTSSPSSTAIRPRSAGSGTGSRSWTSASSRPSSPGAAWTWPCW